MIGNRYAVHGGRVTVLPAWEHLQGAHAAAFEIPPSRLDRGLEVRLDTALRTCIPQGMPFLLVVVDPRVPLDGGGCAIYTSEKPAGAARLLRVATWDVERWTEERKGRDR